MKILYANKFFYPKGGAEISLFLLERLLNERGHSAIHFSTKDHRNLSSPWENDFVSEVNYEGHTTIRQSIKGVSRMFWSREVSKCVRSLVEKTRPDIAVLNNVYHQLGPSLMIELDKLGIPMIMFARDGKLVCPAYTMLRDKLPCEACSGGRFYNSAKYRCGGSRARGALLAMESYWNHNVVKSWSKLQTIVSPSDFLAEKLQQMGITQNIVVHRNVVPKVAPARPSAERFAVGFVGRLSQEKGIDDVIEAALQCPELDFRIVGEGPEEAHIKQLIQARNVSNVTLLGLMPSDSLQQEMRTWRLGIYPSIWYENCPRVVLETLALGIPVVGADIGGIPELVGSAGLLVPPGDSKALSAAISELWHDPARCDRMGKNGIAFVTEFCDEHKYAARIESLLVETIASAPPG